MTDPNLNRGIPGVNVTISKDFSGAPVIQSANTSSTGQFSFSDIPAGNYKVKFTKFGYQDAGIPFSVAGDHSLGSAAMVLEGGGQPTYENSIEAMMGNYCTHCHRPDSIDAVDPPLRTYTEVSNAGTLSHMRIQDGTMPPFTTMPDYYKALFDKWRDLSFPEN